MAEADVDIRLVVPEGFVQVTDAAHVRRQEEQQDALLRICFCLIENAYLMANACDICVRGKGLLGRFAASQVSCIDLRDSEVTRLGGKGRVQVTKAIHGQP